MNDLLPLIRVDKKSYRRVVAGIRGRTHDLSEVERRSRAIIERVKEGGDAALRQSSVELDHVSDMAGEGLRVDRAEARRACEDVDAELLQAMRFSLDRIRKNQGRLLQRLSYSHVSDGFVVRTVPKALASVGCYIPGGRAAYASTVLMTAGVAKLAGVKRVVVCTPPDPRGRVNTAILAAAEICSVDEIYRVGGAQSVAAMAYGTGSIAKVGKIVGPGGIYVSVAKKLVSGDVPIDFFAGPTEIVVMGDESTDPRMAAWDLVGQAEHGEDTLCGLVTWSRDLAERVRSVAATIAASAERGRFVREALRRGFTALCPDRETACSLVNSIAPEHLELLVDDPREISDMVENAGLILEGKYAPCAASDYCIGTDHVIPTLGYATIKSGLSVLDFIKLNWSVEGTKGGLERTMPYLRSLALAEGLPNHYRSVESRFDP